MVAPSLGAEVAGQGAQRTARMEAINTGRPGTRLQAGRPRWDNKARPRALSAAGSLLGLWAPALPTGTKKAEV